MNAFNVYGVFALATLCALSVPRAGHSADTYAGECGACHVAYPPRLLSVQEWGRVLGRLDQHYGTDASLDSEALQTVARRLGVASPRADTPGGTLPRISTKAWFVHEHDEVGAATFRSAKVRSPANCPACHLGADRGDFEEDSVHLPR